MTPIRLYSQLMSAVSTNKYLVGQECWAGCCMADRSSTESSSVDMAAALTAHLIQLGFQYLYITVVIVTRHYLYMVCIVHIVCQIKTT